MPPADLPLTVADDSGAFPRSEYATRLDSVRARMASSGLDCLLVTKPENIYYLVGLDHQGFFAFHLLVVPLRGPLTLVTRAMERATAEAQLPDTEFVGYADGTDPAAVIGEVVHGTGNVLERIGIEQESLCFPPYIHEALRGALREAEWVNASWLIDELRLVKSPLEIEYTRRAARVSDAMMQAALEVSRPGVNEQVIAAEIYHAMALAGGSYPAFAPFIRPSPRMAQEHTTWHDRELQEGEALFLEMAGCVARYHAPLGRFLHLGRAPAGSDYVRGVCHEAFDLLVETMHAGMAAADVYATWFRHVEAAGISDYHRHHCGYLVGLGFPPSWTGGSSVVGLRHDSELVLEQGMVFHLMSWLLGTGKGDYFLSNTVVLTDNGCETLTRSPYPLESFRPGAG